MAYIGFDALKAQLSKQKGVTNPAGLAASIGRKKFSKKRFQNAAKTGKKMFKMKPMTP